MNNFITIATSDPGFEQILRTSFPTALNGELRRVESIPDDLSAAVEVLAGPMGSTTQVVALGPGMNTEVALDLARRFDVDRHEVSIVLIAEDSPGLLEEALDAGVRAVLAPDAKAPDVQAAFERALSVARQRRRSIGAGARRDDIQDERRLITVLSPKGGSGKTIVSVNLAVGLAQRVPRDVVLVDLDLQFGDAASALGLTPEGTITDVARSGDFSAAAVKVALTEHSSGLYILCAPESPAAAEEFPAEAMSAIVDVLAAEFRYVIVDTSAGLSEHSLNAIERSSDLVNVCSMDVPSIRGVHKELKALDQLGMTDQRRHLVLNRANSKVGLDPSDVEALLGTTIDVQIPSSRIVPQSVNDGIPVVESSPRSSVGRQMVRLVERFEAPRTSGGGILRRMRGAR